MTTATLDPPQATRDGAGRDEAPSFVRLVRVELRKMRNTRAGFWLLAAVAALTLLVTVLILVLGDAADRDLRSVMEGAIQPAALLLPVIAILLVTSEWSQRTHLTTFALVPNRMRVVAAKAAAALVLGVVAVLFVRALATAAVALAEGTDDDVLNLPETVLGQTFIFVAAGMLMGIAFGALLLSSAPAIVIYFLLPTVFAALSSIISGDVFDWLDTARTMEPLTGEDLSGEQWAQLGTSLLVWLVVPLVAGIWRIRRSEIN